jgi:hypothetical protein
VSLHQWHCSSGKNGKTVLASRWRNIAITLIFRLLSNGPDLNRIESSRNLSEMA